MKSEGGHFFKCKGEGKVIREEGRLEGMTFYGAAAAVLVGLLENVA